MVVEDQKRLGLWCGRGASWSTCDTSCKERFVDFAKMVVVRNQNSDSEKDHQLQQLSYYSLEFVSN